MVIAGIDPGTSPAIVILTAGPKLVTCERDLRFALRDSAGRTRNEPDLPGLCHLLYLFKPAAVVIEQVASRPAQGVASTGRFLYCTGLLVGAATAAGFNVLRPTPQTWQKALQVRGGKDGARARASELLPELAGLLRVKAAHHLADAALLALWGLQQQSPEERPAW